MRNPVRPAAATAVVCLLLGLGAAGCSEKGGGFDLARLLEPSGPAPSPAPVPNSPANALRLLEWCYNNRSLASCRELFSEDFRFYCGPLDSAGAEWRGTPWTRDDELICTTHLFCCGGPDQPPASIIRLTFDRNFFVFPDPNYSGWDAPGRWHKSIRTTVTLQIATTDGSSIEITGHATFHFVRGDSALIPEELRQRGFGPDSTRWYIRCWDDETLQEASAPAGSRTRGVASARRQPGELDALPGSKVTWCQLKALYR